MGKPKQPASAAGTIRIHATSNAKGQTEIDLSHHSLTYIPLQVFQVSDSPSSDTEDATWFWKQIL